MAKAVTCVRLSVLLLSAGGYQAVGTGRLPAGGAGERRPRACTLPVPFLLKASVPEEVPRDSLRAKSRPRPASCARCGRAHLSPGPGHQPSVRGTWSLFLPLLLAWLSCVWGTSPAWATGKGGRETEGEATVTCARGHAERREKSPGSRHGAEAGWRVPACAPPPFAAGLAY